MNDALAAVVSQSQSKKISTSSKARQYKSSAPRTWLEWTPAQKSLCVQQLLEGNYNHPLTRTDSSERTMKALLVTWLAEWAASPLTTTHVLSSWNMVFTKVPVTESVDDVDLPCPSAAIPMPAPLLFVVPGHVSDSEEASETQAEADEASGAEVEDNIDVLSVPGKPAVQRAAKRRAETRLDRLAERFRAAPRDVHAQRVARENRTKKKRTTRLRSKL